MVLEAIVKEDGTLIAKAPKALWGKKFEIIVNTESKSRPPRKLSQWERMKRALQDIDALNLPEREFTDILTELRTFKETLITPYWIDLSGQAPSVNADEHQAGA